MKQSTLIKALMALAGFAVVFVSFWVFFTLSGGDFRFEINGQPLAGPPAVQGALAAMLLLLSFLAMVVVFVVMFSFTWLSIGMIFIATLAIIGLAFLPILAPILLPLAFFFLLLALFNREESNPKS